MSLLNNNFYELIFFLFVCLDLFILLLIGFKNPGYYKKKEIKKPEAKKAKKQSLKLEKNFCIHCMHN